MRLLPENLRHYIRYRLGLDAARTQMTAGERELLKRLAPGRRVIVELGMFEGASSVLLRQAMDPDAELYCIDPFPIGRLPFSVQLSIARREIGRSANGRVRLVRSYSHQAISDWGSSIDLLIMDGDHSFEGAARDFREWTRFIRTGGLVAIHTSRDSAAKRVPARCGPLRLVNEVVSNDPCFEIVDSVDSMTLARRV